MNAHGKSDRKLSEPETEVGAEPETEVVNEDEQPLESTSKSLRILPTPGQRANHHNSTSANSRDAGNGSSSNNFCDELHSIAVHSLSTHFVNLDENKEDDYMREWLDMNSTAPSLHISISNMTKPKLGPCVPLPIDNEVLKEVIDKAKDWALMHGVGLRIKEKFCLDSIYFAPFLLLPSSFPREEFEKAVQTQTIVNELIHKVAYNHEFLSTHLSRAIKVDEFTNRLYKLYMTMREEGFAQGLSLGLLRADAMVCTSQKSIKQVEVNTIASSMAGVTNALVGWHRYVLLELGYADKAEQLPKNTATAGLSQGLIDAWEYYGQPSAVVMFVVEEIICNICDQRFLEFEVRKLNQAVRVIRRTFPQLSQLAKLAGKEKRLLVGNDEVAVVYYRTGYAPTDYPRGEADWEVRYLIERSRAIKCPSVQYHLAGTKKVQQALALPGVLDKLLNDPVKVEAVKETFAGLYSLDMDDAGDRAVEMAMNDPCRFVMKPQREGGGNNLYDLDIKTELERIKDSEEREGWILMDRIIPPIQQNYIIRPGQEELPTPVEVVSELGVYGVVIGDEAEIYINRPAGHMLRTKLRSSNEAGVMAGCGALDSPYLC